MRNLRLSLLVAASIVGTSTTALAADPQIDRGKYLVTIAGCND
jgi:hypothetical protein